MTKPTPRANKPSKYGGGLGHTIDAPAIEFVLLDLDGVVWLSREALPGAPEAVRDLRASGRRVLFVTNNSLSVVADQEAALDAIGIPAVGDVVTSAQAGAALIAPGESVLVAGGPGVIEAVDARDAIIHPGGSNPDMVDVVIVGLHRNFDFARLDEASRLIRNGARFIATNDDATFPTPTGLTPGAGSIVAAVATASGIAPTIAGKPYQPMAELVATRCGPGFGPDTAVMVGDRLDTDGRFATAVGCPFALVRSGVTLPTDPAPPGIAIDAADLAAVADVLLAE